MTHGNLSACLPVTLAHEGGLSMIRSDPGNWTGGKVGRGALKGTNMGIAASAHPTLDIAHLTKAEAAAIYEREYWTPAGCEELPAGLDLCHFDATVNSGPSASARWLDAARSGDVSTRIRAYSSARLHSLEGLKTWARFGRGWSARVAGIEAAALKMVGAPALARAGIHANAGARAASAGAHAATAAAGAAALAVPSHPLLGSAVGIASLCGAIWGAWTASAAKTRAAVLTYAATADSEPEGAP